MNRLELKRSDVRNVVLLLLVQCVAAALIDPRGNFALNDDWAYAHSVQWLQSEGRIRLSDWIAMTLLPQTLLGGGVSALFGFHFEVLRGFTFCLALLVSALLYTWFRQLNAKSNEAALYVAAMLATPWWWPLALSYMTEFYSLIFFVPSAMLAVKLLRDDAPSWSGVMWLAVICAVGTLQRQVNAVVPMAWMIVMLWSCVVATSARPWQHRVKAVFPFAFTLCAYALYVMHLKAGPGMPASQATTNARLLQFLADLGAGDLTRWKATLLLSLGWFGYVGISLATLSLVWLAGTRARRITIAAAFCVTLVFIAAWWAMGMQFPFKEENVWDRLGIGPFTLVGGFQSMPNNALPRHPHIAWALLLIASAVGAATFVIALARECVRVFDREQMRSREALVSLFLLLTFAVYTVPFLVTDFFDRYVFFILPIVIAIASRAFEARRSSVARRWPIAQAAVLTAMLTYSVAATHDYFAWQRARWAAIALAQQEGAMPDTLDAGFEYNGWHRFELTPRGSSPGRSWWWVKDDMWVVSYAPREGYAVVSRSFVRKWLPTTPREIVLSKRMPS